MIRFRALAVLMTLLLTSCNQVSSPTPEAPPATLTAAEFRAAAEDRVSWRDPDISSNSPRENWVSAKILGFSDFHGSLNGQSIAGRPVGGAAVLAAYLKAEAAEVGGRAVIVHAGDMVGASPPVSGLMQDEPTIRFLNLLANDYCRSVDVMNPQCNMVGTPGNHEFDEGADELLRLLYGGKHADAVALAGDWAGAKIPYVSANVLVTETGETLLPAYAIKDIGGVPVAFIGAVLEHAKQIVTPAGVAGLEFIDEASAINWLVPELQAKGVRAIVVSIHQGTRQVNFGDAAIVGKGGLQGEIIDIVAKLDDEIDIVVSGHAHGYTNVLVPNASGKAILLTQAFSTGTAYDDIDISLDPASGDIVEKSAAIITTWADLGPGLTPDRPIMALVDHANTAVQPLVSRVVGVAAIDIVRTQNDAGESALGNLIADAQLAAMVGQFALMAPGGIRADIAGGNILWGDVFTVQPFGNDLIAMTLSGAQIGRLLNQQWVDPLRSRIMQVSGMSFTWDANRPVGDRIVEIRDATGTALDPAAAYRIITNNFLAAGGDGFTVLTEGTDSIVGPGDLDATVAYIKAQQGPVSASIEGRITRLN